MKNIIHAILLICGCGVLGNDFLSENLFDFKGKARRLHNIGRQDEKKKKSKSGRTPRTPSYRVGKKQGGLLSTDRSSLNTKQRSGKKEGVVYVEIEEHSHGHEHGHEHIEVRNNEHDHEHEREHAEESSSSLIQDHSHNSGSLGECDRSAAYRSKKRFRKHDNGASYRNGAAKSYKKKRKKTSSNCDGDDDFVAFDDFYSAFKQDDGYDDFYVYFDDFYVFDDRPGDDGFGDDGFGDDGFGDDGFGDDGLGDDGPGDDGLVLVDDGSGDDGGENDDFVGDDFDDGDEDDGLNITITTNSPTLAPRVDRRVKPIATSPPTYAVVSDDSPQRAFVASLGRYPGSLHPVDTTGQILIRFDETGKDKEGLFLDRILVELKDVEGLEANCDGCEVKVHSGNSCENEEVIGGTVKDKFEDGNPIYSTNEKGLSNSQFVMDTGLSYANDTDLVIALYDSEGDGIACGVLRYGATNNKADTLVAKIAKLPSYEGALEPGGRVKLTFNEEDSRFSLSYHLAGIDKECTACKISVRNGVDCADSDNIGGPYWNSDAVSGNPWDRVAIDSGGQNFAQGNYFFDSGYGFFDSVSKVVVVENEDGDMIGCGQLLSEANTDTDKYLVAEINDHPGNKGPYIASGKIHVQHKDNGDLIIEAELTGVEKSCQTYACTIAIHEGKDCQSVESIGGQYWDTVVSRNNIWKNSTYVASEGQSLSKILVPKGPYTFFDNMGHAIVITDSSGTKIGCGVLGPGTKKPTRDILHAEMKRYPLYKGDLRPEGNIEVIFSEKNELMVVMDMIGLENECEKCKIQIKTGTSCDDPFSVGVPYYSDDLNKNPWEKKDIARYNATGGATSSMFKLNTGYGFNENLGHTIVVHGEDGAPRSCGVLLPKETREQGTTLYSTVSLATRAFDRELTPTGDVSLQFINGKAILKYEIINGYKNCNNCPVTFRAVNTCDFRGNQINGIDYSSSTYSSDSTGYAKGQIIFDDFPLEYMNLLSQVVMFDNNDEGGSVACGVLNIGDQVAGSKKYVAHVSRPAGFEEEPEKKMFGTFTIFEMPDGDNAIAVGNLAEMMNCENTCPMDISEGDCSDPGPATVVGFPRLKTDAEGNSKHTYVFPKGADLNGKLVVLKAPSGKVMSCGKLEEVKQTESPSEFIDRLTDK